MSNEIEVQAKKQLDEIRAALESGQFTAKEMPFPKAGAARAFQVTAAGCLINVVQANTTERGIVHEGIAASTGGFFNIMRLPPDFADYVYHKVAGVRN